MGGVWSVLKNLARAQASAGYDVRLGLLLTPAWPHRQELVGAGLPFWEAWTPELFGTAAFSFHRWIAAPVAGWCAEICRQRSAAPVVLHYHDAWLSGCLVLPRSRAAGVVQVATFHGFAGRSALERQPIRRALHRRMAQRLVRERCTLISVDRQNLAAIHELFGLDPNAFHFVPTGVDPPDGTPSRRSPPGRPLRVGHVGTIDEGKGWRITAQAVERLIAEGRQVTLTIAGAGPETRPAREWCKDRTGFAQFLGYVPNAGAAVTPQLDVLSLPSRTEGLPVAVLEAMAAGVVVVATPVGGILDAVVHGQTGFLVERNTPAVCAALRQLSDSPDLVDRMASAALARYQERYTPTAMRLAYEHVYGI
ncbi:MAG: glycosyltransferase family 4 protein [Acidobacteriota bacterium]